MSAPADNLSAVLHKIGDLRVEKRPIPEPKDDEVLLKMECVGICGSDVHYYVHGRIADFVVKEPLVMGHESSGVVTKLGKNVTSLKVGDRVAIEPGVSCRMCSFCKEGLYNLCLDVKFCATPPDDGNLCRYYTHAADFCHKLPDHVTLEEGALMEPLSVGVHACRRGYISVGSTVLVIGAGPIGLVTLACAKAMGAKQVIITDLVEFRLNMAKELGANHVLKVNREDDEKVITKKIISILGERPDVSIDCTGFQNTVRLGLEATKNGGIMVLVGMGANEVTIPLGAAACREVDIRGVFRYANDYPLALSLIASGKVDIKKLITHRYKLEETVKAFETAKTGSDNAIKVMIHCNK